LVGCDHVGVENSKIKRLSQNDLRITFPRRANNSPLKYFL
jgi:hypothetical protein